MKKLIIASALALSSVLAFSADFGVSGVRDYNLEKNGVRLELTTAEFYKTTPKFNVTLVDNSYDRWAGGVDVPLGKLGYVNFLANVSGVYQNTKYSPDGYGLSGGLTAKVPMNQYLTLTAGVERFAGQDRIKEFNNTTTFVGVLANF